MCLNILAKYIVRTLLGLIMLKCSVGLLIVQFKFKFGIFRFIFIINMIFGERFSICLMVKMLVHCGYWVLSQIRVRCSRKD